MPLTKLSYQVLLINFEADGRTLEDIQAKLRKSSKGCQMSGWTIWSEILFWLLPSPPPLNFMALRDGRTSGWWRNSDHRGSWIQYIPAV